MRFKVEVQLKPEVLDPEGRAILKMVQNQGLEQVKGVSAYKSFLVEVDDDASDPMAVAEKVAKDFLTNPVSHSYKITKG